MLGAATGAGTWAVGRYLKAKVRDEAIEAAEDAYTQAVDAIHQSRKVAVRAAVANPTAPRVRVSDGHRDHEGGGVQDRSHLGQGEHRRPGRRTRWKSQPARAQWPCGPTTSPSTRAIRAR